MTSKEAMKKACSRLGVKAVAETLKLSPNAIYNQINDPEKPDMLRRFVDFAKACKDDTPVKWACEELKGIFIKNSELAVKKENVISDCLPAALKEFSELIKEIGNAMDDKKITAEEAARIRKEWEDLKRLLETFVLACEFGYIGGK